MIQNGSDYHIRDETLRRRGNKGKHGRGRAISAEQQMQESLAIFHAATNV
jgi:hypothetical protein